MNTIPSVRDSIKLNVTQSLAIVARIRSTKGRERYNAWAFKRDIGQGTRYLLLALAFLRKRSYKQAEPHTRTAIDAHKLAAVLGAPGLHTEVTAWLDAPAEQKAAA